MHTARAPSFQGNRKAREAKLLLKVTRHGGPVRAAGLRASLRPGSTVSPPPSGSQISWAQAAGLPNSSASSSIPGRRCLGLWASCCPKEEHRKLPPCVHRSQREPPSPQAAAGLGAKARPVVASPAPAPQQGIASIVRMLRWGLRLAQ